MATKDVAVIDFGSSSITMLVGCRDVNNTFCIKASEEVGYSGFMDGEFLRPEEIAANLREVLEGTTAKYKKRIKKVYVGVPSEFCVAKECAMQKAYGKRVKIKQKNIDELFDIEDEKRFYTIANKKPSYYLLDDVHNTENPIGSYANVIEAGIGYIYIKNDFIDQISSILNNLGVVEVEFICTSLAQANYMIPEEERVKDAILVDCGYITTSVAKVSFEAITDLKSFSLGGGYITNDIAEVLNISFDEAEQLKRKLIICVEPSKEDYYEIVDDNGELVQFSMKKVNDIAIARIEAIADAIKNRCINAFKSKIEPHTPVYLTGGGLSYIKGIKDLLSKVLERKIHIIVPAPPQLAKPELSAVVSLLDMSINMEK